MELWVVEMNLLLSKPNLYYRFKVNVHEDDKPIECYMYELYSPLNIQREIENIIKTKGETYLLSELFEK